MVTVSNTPGRTAELTTALTTVLDRGTLGPEEAARLRGRLTFAEQQLWGRNSRRAVLTFADVPPDAPDSHPLSDEQQQATRFLLQHVLQGPPRRHSITPRRTYHLFLDGSCEYAQNNAWPTCGLGGVLIGPEGLEFWGLQC